MTTAPVSTANMSYYNTTTTTNGSPLPIQEENPKEWLLLLQITCLTVISIVGTVGNCMIVTGMLRNKRRSSDYFILNLATTDFLVCAIGIPLDVYEQQHNDAWPYAEIACNFIYPSQTLFVLVSIMTLTAMSLERYRAIMTPLKHKLSKKVISGIILLIWNFGIAVIVPYSKVLYVDKDGYCSESWPGKNDANYYTLALFIVDYCIPLTIISYCYSRAGYQLHSKCVFNRREDSIRSQHSAMKKRLENNKRVIKTFSFAVVIFVICMLPGDVYWMWASFGDASGFKYEAPLRTFTNIMLYANSAINPFIFGACSRQGCRGQRKRFLRRLYDTITETTTSRTNIGLGSRKQNDPSKSDRETHV